MSVIIPLIANPYVFAGRSPKFKHADRNKDGTVDKFEWRQEKKWENKQRQRADRNNDGVVTRKEKRSYWKHTHSRVNTALEGKYDSNADGWLQPQEAKEFLQDRYTLIKTKGKAKVDSALEEEYDTDADGILDMKEIEDLREDLL